MQHRHLALPRLALADDRHGLGGRDVVAGLERRHGLDAEGPPHGLGRGKERVAAAHGRAPRYSRIPVPRFISVTTTANMATAAATVTSSARAMSTSLEPRKP